MLHFTREAREDVEDEWCANAMRNKYVTEYKGCTIEVIGENDFMYRIIKRGAKGQRMDLFVDMFYRSTSDALKGAMRWIDNNVRKE